MSKIIKIPTLDYIEIPQEGKKVYVGTNSGDFPTISSALEELSKYNPIYRTQNLTPVDTNPNDPINHNDQEFFYNCEICIRNNYIITEQIYISQLNLSYISITTEATDNIVNVNGSSWINNTRDNLHDTRDNVAFIICENGATAPVIRVIFKLINNPRVMWYNEDNGAMETNTRALGLLCNKSSTAFIDRGCGFDGFFDGVISNNESSVTIREGIVQNCTRYGVHARHNGEISAAHSLLLNNCVAAYADRCADLDIRKSDCSGSKVMAIAENVSRITANGSYSTGTVGYTEVINGTIYDINNSVLSPIMSLSGSTINFNKGSLLYNTVEEIQTPTLLTVGKGGILIISGASANLLMQDPSTSNIELSANVVNNTFNPEGIIFA